MVNQKVCFKVEFFKRLAFEEVVVNTGLVVTAQWREMKCFKWSMTVRMEKQPLFEGVSFQNQEMRPLTLLKMYIKPVDDRLLKKSKI